MSTLITGATGFIGQELLKTDHPFICVTRQKEVNTHHTLLQIKNIDGDSNWEGAFKNVDSILHLAGLAHNNNYTEEDYNRVNVEGTLKLAEEAAKSGVKRFVFVSSIVVNGTTSGNTPFTPTSKPNPQSPYAKSKYRAELGLQDISEKTGLELIIVRPPLVYGANAPGNFSKLVKLIDKTPALPFGLVNNRRNFIYVKNLADFLILCIKSSEIKNCTLLPADSEVVSTKEFSKIISKSLNRHIIQIPIPIKLLRLGLLLTNKKQMGQQLFDNLELDQSHILKALNWTPAIDINTAMHRIHKNFRGP